MGKVCIRLLLLGLLCGAVHAQVVLVEQVIMRENGVDASGNSVELSTWTMANGSYATGPARNGTRSVRILDNGVPTLFWSSAFITNFSLAPFDSFSFWINSPVANPAISVTATSQSNVTTGDINQSRLEGPRIALPASIPAGSWTQVAIPIAELIPDAANRYSVVQLAFHGSVGAAVYIDDLSLVGSHAPTAGVRVDAGSVVRAVDRRVIGTGLAYWNGDNNTDRVKGYVADLNLGALRYVSDTNVRKFTPGGFGNSIGLVKANPQAALYTILHGWNAALDMPASLAEAKALVAYLRVPAGNDPRGAAAPLWDKRAVAIDGFDAAYEVYDGATPRTVRYRELPHSAGWWADLRATTPLAVDDGYNHLRIGSVEPINMTYFELDNEPFWNFAASTILPTVAQYVAWVKQLVGPGGITEIDPDLKWGVPATGSGNNGTWDREMFNTLAAAPARVPHFISHHHYTGAWDDYEALLSGTAARSGDATKGPNGTWPMEALRYRRLLDEAYGATPHANVELAITELNVSDSTQASQSLTDALFFADQVGQVLDSEFSTLLTFHLGADSPPSGAPSYSGSPLYGWQDFRGYGMLQKTRIEPRTPHYWGLRMAGLLAQRDAKVVRASSDNLFVGAYATTAGDGSMNLMLVNKAKDTDISTTIELSAFVPRPEVTVYRFGKAQDEAARTGPTGLEQSTLNNAATRFSVTLPAYSISVLRLAAAASPLAGPTLSSNPTRAASGGSVTASWSGLDAPAPSHWIGLHRKSSPAKDPSIARMFIGCGQTPGSASASGSCLFPIPAGSRNGTYELRLHAPVDAKVIARSAPLTVSGSGAASLPDDVSESVVSTTIGSEREARATPGLPSIPQGRRKN
jgi:alpha-L-arabinofuranosidase